MSFANKLPPKTNRRRTVEHSPLQQAHQTRFVIDGQILAAERLLNLAMNRLNYTLIRSRFKALFNELYYENNNQYETAKAFYPKKDKKQAAKEWRDRNPDRRREQRKKSAELCKERNL